MKLLPIAIGLLTVVCTINAETQKNTSSTVGSEKKSQSAFKKLLDLGKDAVNAVKTFNSLVGGLETAITTVESLSSAINGEDPPKVKDAKNQHAEVISHLREISTEIKAFSDSISRNLDKSRDDITTQVENIIDKSQLSQHISHLMESIHIEYTNSLALKTRVENHTLLNTDTLYDFVDRVFRQTNSVENMVQGVYAEFFKPASGAITGSFLESFVSYSRGQYSTRCNKNVSPNYQLYLIYLSIYVNELKALETTAYGYTIRSMLNRGTSYATELDDHFNRFESRMTRYNSEMRRVLPAIPRDIRRCNVPMNGLVSSRLHFIAESVHNLGFVEFSLSTNLDENCATDTCEDKFKRPNTLESVFKVGTNVTVCFFSHPYNERFIEWARTETGLMYGQYKPCESGERTVARYKSDSFWSNLFSSELCNICGWTRTATLQIVLDSRVSNIYDNMVITAVRLTIDNGVSIQIKEGKLLPNGLVEKRSSEFIGEGGSTDILDEHPTDSLKPGRKFMYLDDVIVDPGYVVTGVQFTESAAGDGFKLIVRGTKYDAKSGTLFPRKNKWFDPEEVQSHNTEGYNRQRNTLLNNGKKNPYRCSYFSPHETTNEKIEFRHTDLHDDAGQTTVPLLDGQEVYMDQPVPLNGVGLFYKNGYEYGGIIAVRIFTESGERFID